MRKSITFTSTLSVAIGVIAALLVLEARSKPTSEIRPAGSMLPETSGPLREIVIQYIAGDTIAMPVYRDFLPQLRSHVLIHVVSPDQAAFSEFQNRIGTLSCRVNPIFTGHEMTVWSRDRWAAVAPKDPLHPIQLFTSTEEDASANWPQRAGDARIAADLSKALPGQITANRLPLYFDGGDLLATEHADIFVAPRVLDRNVNRTIASAEALIDLLHKALGGRIILLKQAPDHHAGMYMMSLGNHTMLVADPKLGKPFQNEQTPELPGGADFSESTQETFDAVAEQVEKDGYRVVRIPTIPSTDGKTFLTYVNVMTEQRNGKDIVYLPKYQGAEAMNDAAAQVWKSLGYEVHPIDCTSSYRFFGNLHCLVNVLRRG